MKRVIILLLLMLAFTLESQAQSVKDGTYRIECNYYPNGSFVLGEACGMENTPYYYSMTAEGDDVLWTFASVGDGSYTIRAKRDGSFVTYTGRYEGNYKYIEPTAGEAGSASHWTIEWLEDGTMAIVNVKEPSHHFHVRDTQVAGSYAGDQGYGGQSRFHLWTADGELVDNEPTTSSYADLLQTMRFDGVPALYDNAGNRLFVSVAEQQRGCSTFCPVITHEIPDNYSLYIEGKRVNNGTTLELNDIGNDTQHVVRLREKGVLLFECNLVFTYLPIVSLNGKGFSASNHEGTFRFTSAQQDTLCNMVTHWRGNTSVHYPKKNYAVNIKDSEGESMNIQLMDMRNDNHWILDAMQIDVARMRNRVSTDIWNDFHTAPYYIDEAPKAQLGTKGHFVEMILNGNYNGLYCLTEKMDRKEFRITKTSDDPDTGAPVFHGLFYKAIEWGPSTYFGNDGSYGGFVPPEPNDASFSWSDFEIKYPDVEDGEPGTWQPLYEAVDFVSNASNSEFRSEIAERFDLPVLRDYWLMIELAMAFDNKAKNMLWAIRDLQQSPRLTLGLWDMDGTWGRVWNGSIGGSDPTNGFDQETGSSVLFYRLHKLNPDKWRTGMAERYAELRNAGIFDAEALTERFERYAELFHDCGADVREIALWSNTQNVTPNWDEEIPYIADWIEKRLKTMDEKYGYNPLAGIARTTDSPADRPQQFYDLQGRRVSQPAQGIYIRNGRKTIRR